MLLCTTHVQGAEVGPSPEILDSASAEFCATYTRETAQFMLQEGPPEDVELMEAAIPGLAAGEWVVESQTMGHTALDTPGHFAVSVRCSWRSPFADLNGEFDLDYHLVTDPGSGAILNIDG